VVDLAGGEGEFSVVTLHGSSGLTADDDACRVAQFDQAFVDLGDGAPGANGERNLVLGDLNTDPGRYPGIDASAARWNEHITGRFGMHTELGPDVEPTYGGLTNIDHVASDSFIGECVHPGLSGIDVVLDAVYFDHLPVVCRLQNP
jgi:hypothetical protein